MRIPSPTSRSGNKIFLSVWDLFWVVVTPVLALYLRNPALVYDPENWEAVGSYWLVAIGCSALAIFALRLQDGMTRHFSVHDALDVAEAVLFAELTTFLALFALTRLDRIPRIMPLTHGLLLLGGLLLARILIKLAFADEAAPRYQSRGERIIVIGANPLAASFIRLIEAFVPQRQSVIAVLDASSEIIGKAISGVRVLGPPHELEAVIAEFAVHGIETDRVVVAGEADLLGESVLHEVERICKKRHVGFSFLPRMLGLTEMDLQAQTLPEPPQFAAAPAYFLWKRLIDLVVASALIVVLSPVFVVAGLLVFMDVGRPLLFWQERLGWKGRSFLIYKFRTLRAPFGAAASDDDPKQIRKPSWIGRFLRVTRVDELPQLFNVVLGDMSLIGPRPLLPEDQPSNVAVRLSVRPGISGWAQIKGGKLVTPEEKEKLDEWYVRNASIWLDLRIVLDTLRLLANARMSSAEAVADSAQAQTKFMDLKPTANAPSVTAPQPIDAVSTLMKSPVRPRRQTSVRT